VRGKRVHNPMADCKRLVRVQPAIVWLHF
jgi:hypothetical protein